MESEDYDDKEISNGSFAPNLCYPQNRANGSSLGNHDYQSTEQNILNGSQN